jgi:hypothetical protein
MRVAAWQSSQGCPSWSPLLAPPVGSGKALQKEG